MLVASPRDEPRRRRGAVVQELAQGAEVAGYRIVSLIGRGGMSMVYLAEDPRLGRKVALKLLSPGLTEDANFRERFARESRIAASIDHPHIVPIYEAGEAEGALYIAMRYVEGTDLRARIRSTVKMPAREALALVVQVASALDAAHRRGLVHRDVKPGNILLTRGAGPGDHCYLTDFGLTKRIASESRFTATGHFMGTIDYVAPEQIHGKALDGRTDQYALACVFFEMLSGSAPLHRDTDLAVVYAHLQDEPQRLSAVRPDLPAALDSVLSGALAKRMEDRFSSCMEFVQEAAMSLGFTIDPHPPTATATDESERSESVDSRVEIGPISPISTYRPPAIPVEPRVRWMRRAIVGVGASVALMLPLINLGVAASRGDLRIDAEAVPSVTSSSPVPESSPTESQRTGSQFRVLVPDDTEELFTFDIDIKDAAVEIDGSELTLSFSPVGKATVKGASARWLIDTTNDLGDGCGGFEMFVSVSAQGSELREYGENCLTTTFVAKTQGRLTRQGAAVILDAKLLPRSFRWRLEVQDGFGRRDHVPDLFQEPPRFKY
jgi:serine/threonine-protein kinase